MTDRPLDRRDELASALLDGEPVGDARAADPAVRARAEQLRAVAEAVRAPVPAAPASARDAAVAAALEVFDAAGAEPVPGSPSPSPGRWWQRGSGPPDRRLRLLGAAAAVLLVLAAIPVVASLSRTADDDTASAPAAEAEPDADGDALMETFTADGADDLGAAAADAADPGDELRQAAGDAGGGGGVGLVDLGVHDDAETLAARAAAAAGLDPEGEDADEAVAAPAPVAGSGPPGVTTTVADDPRPCEAEIAALDGDLLLVGLARLGVDAVVVAVLDRPEGATVVVFDPEPPRCHVISEIAV
jgi:hypothetical protein